MVDAIEQVQKSLGFSGRSELVRAAIRMMIADTKEKESIVGKVNAIVVVTHSEDSEEPVTRLKHLFEDVVKTHIHNKITRSNCVELFLLEGAGEKIASMTKAFQKEEGMKSVKLIVI